LEIIAVGGYEEVGRNMTLVKSGDESVIIDMGIRLDRVMIHEDTDITKLGEDELIRRGIVPDDSVVEGKVKAIILSHGHLDHIGAVPYLAEKYNAPIIGTPFTIELVKAEQRYKGKLKNQLVTLEHGETVELSRHMSMEFVRMTHSIPHSSMCALHTKEGTLVYANDFKLDDSPVIGDKPDYDRLKELGSEGVKAVIVETLRVHEPGRTPSEAVAKKLVEDIILKTDPDKGTLITTFSSQIARLTSIVEMASSMGRIPVLLGRSMQKYSSIAERLGLLDLPEGTRVYGDQKSIKKAFNRIVKDGKDKYLPVVTGHQGEPDALLSKIANGKMPYRIEKDDQVIFSSYTIPNPINQANKYTLETKLRMQGARIFEGCHVSGHASREDHRDIINMLNPENIIPCHGDLRMLAGYTELAEELGYRMEKDIFLRRHGQKVVL
jgi:ribonuclease J